MVASAQVSSPGGTELAPSVSSALPRRRSRWAARKQAYMFASPALFLILVFISTPEPSLKIDMDPKTLMDPWRNSHFTAEKFRSAFPGAGGYLDALKESFPYTHPDPQIPGSDEYRRRLHEALNQAAEEWDKITKCAA